MGVGGLLRRALIAQREVAEEKRSAVEVFAAPAPDLVFRVRVELQVTFVCVKHLQDVHKVKIMEQDQQTYSFAACFEGHRMIGARIDWVPWKQSPTVTAQGLIPLHLATEFIKQQKVPPPASPRLHPLPLFCASRA